jgi:hypothetical protein
MPAAGPQCLGREGGHRGLAIRAGHADDRQLLRRPAEPGIGRIGQRAARAIHDQLRHRHVRQLALDDRGDRPALGCRGCEVVAVDVNSGDREEHSARRDAARVVRQRVDLADRDPDHALGGHDIREGAEAHPSLAGHRRRRRTAPRTIPIAARSR